MTVETTVHGAPAMEELGRRVAGVLRAGDLILLGGDLGAGKTTFMRGLGEGLQVRGPITSPTFVLARRHPSLCGGPQLVHVDAYRLDDLGQLRDLDLETDLLDAVVAVEWGIGMADMVCDSWLEIAISGSGDRRTVRISGHGPRWPESALPA